MAENPTGLPLDITKPETGIKNFDIAVYSKLLKTKDESYWWKAGEKKALKLFHEAAKRVPAYKDFLKKHKVNPAKVKTIADFKSVPATTKKNYVYKYPVEKRCWDGDISKSDMVAISSGTSGEPSYWPRGSYQELEAAAIHEIVYKDLFHIDKHKTLIVVCFPMGIYVSGVATLLPSWLVTTKGYDVTVATPGNKKGDILATIKSLQSKFEQVVIIGHPFLVKDVIESGKKEGINWSNKKLKMMFCSEGFSEGWRDYMTDITGIKNKADLISTYGSSEMLLMGHETPFSIFVRRLVNEDSSIVGDLSDEKMLPNVFQFNPLMRYIEEDGENLLFTSASGLPMIRFDMHDSGEVIRFRDIEADLKEKVPGWKAKFRKEFPGSPLWELPIVTLRGRSDQTVVFYAANIYPEHVKMALDTGHYNKKLTGKFTMRIGYKKNHDPYFEINIEMQKGVKPSAGMAKKIQKDVIKTLLEINMEYLFISTNNPGKDFKPRIKVYPYQHDKYFKLGLKPKYICK